ncbi:MAG: hypothetical protein AAF492_22205, partial [Verrucomicrobiota bacterium]
KGEGFAPPDEQFDAVFQTAQQMTASWGGEFLFVYLPAWERCSGKGLPPHDFYRADVLERIERLGIPHIDLTPRFEAIDDLTAIFPFGLFGHYTPAGYRIVTDEILGRLEP